MPSETIQWFPGHMAKTRRLIAECLPQVDIVLEVLDARIPKSSANPDLSRLIADKPLLKLLNKSSLADTSVSHAFTAYYRKKGIFCLETDCLDGTGIREIPRTVQTILADKLARYAERGMQGRRLRAMIVGIPNVGKSSLINRLAGGKKTKVENRPGVTRDKQWVPAGEALDLLDTPGVLWPKFDDPTTGLHLALTGAIKDAVLDLEEIACSLLKILAARYPDRLSARYRVTEEEIASFSPYDLFLMIGKRRGFVISGGEPDTDRTCRMLLDEFRRGVLGGISLEFPKETDDARL